MVARRFAPITWAACCDHRRYAGRSGATPATRSRTTSSRAFRTTASAPRSACKKRSGSKSRPTASFAAAPIGAGSWNAPRAWRSALRCSNSATTTAAIRRTHPLALDEFVFLRATTSVTAKVTLPAPSTMHFLRFSDFADRAAYAEVDRFFADLVGVFQQEIADLAGAGCRYLQIDEIAIALLCDRSIRDKVATSGGDPDALIERYIDAINGAIAACPGDVVVGIHMCRGNFRGRHLADGGYESVAERFFARADANHFLLQYDTPRAGGFAPLRFVPKGKGVVLGLISSKTPVLESMDSLQRRADEAAKYIGLERLAISPQCGFASSAAGNPLSEADERAKLRLVVDAARVIWR